MTTEKSEKSQDEDMMIRVGGLVSGILLILIGFVLTGFGLVEGVPISILGAIIGIGAIWITSRKKTNKNKGKGDFEIELDDIQSDVKELLMAKHHDYGQKNLERYGAQGICLRITDKVERLGTILWDSAQVSEEGAEQECFDIIGYCAQLIRLIREGKIKPDPAILGRSPCPFCKHRYKKKAVTTPETSTLVGTDEKPYLPDDAVVIFCPNCVGKTMISMGMIASDVPIVCHACGLSFKSDKEGGWIKIDKWVYDDEHFSHLEPIVPSAHDDYPDADEKFLMFAGSCICQNDCAPVGELGSCGYDFADTSEDMACNMETCPQHWRGTD